ncbi:MAG TPA: polysaccharide deacetylase family protein [Burkholderiales bacterium]|jgi:peptidoglycan/xylan/chitin deacetylase (PgdA/CDA1 family)
MKLALKVDVDTFRGTREGVPRLARLLERRGAGASFFFSLGPDHTGRALRRLFRKEFFRKVQRTSVVRHYGVRTLLYGTLLPGPDIGRRCAGEMRAVRAAGFEVGVHCWDHVRWQDFVAGRDAAWTEREMALAGERFESIFGERPRSWAAAGWQVNRHAAAWQERTQLDYASDTRGFSPFVPLWGGEAVGCVQLPTTLATLDELIGRDGDPVASLLAATAAGAPHVFTAHAELEGGELANLLERLLAGWSAQGYEIVSLEAMLRTLAGKALPRHEVVFAEVPGRSGTLAVQGPVSPS